MKTVLITGCSSGFGLEIARHFLDNGWKVVATMRRPQPDLLPVSENLKLVALDVRDADSIQKAVVAAGPIDVLVNNAGIGFLNALEGTSAGMMRDLFETNTIGTMAMIQAVLPGFRERREGVIINVTSSVTLKPLPLLSAYTASKAAVNAFTESVALELAPFNIRTHIVLPGRAPTTKFGENAMAKLEGEGGFPDAYASIVQEVFAGWQQQDPADVTYAGDVVQAVWRAATDASAPMRIPAGADAMALSA